jgi:hypothetical protein
MSKLETNTIDTVSGTSTLQVGSTNTSTITLGVSGDTINVPSGVTIANSGTATGFGGANTPNFFVYKNSSQTISDATATKITWTSEVFDTASAFASDKFTVPSGQAGKYLFSFASHTYDASEKLTQSNKAFYKNGSQVGSLDRTDGTYEFVTDNRVYTILLNLSVGDYIETYVWGNTTDNSSFSVYGEGQYYTYFQGFKIIE